MEKQENERMRTDIPVQSSIKAKYFSRAKWQLYLSQVFGYGWWLTLFALALILRRFLFTRVELAEAYSSRIRPVLMWPLTALTNLLPISLSFIALIGFIVLLLLILVRLLLTGKQERGKRLIYLFKHIRFIASLLAISFLLYMLFHGLNFARRPLAYHMGVELRRHSAEELYDAAVWLRDETSAIRKTLEEDSDGLYMWPAGESRSSMLAAAYEGYEDLSGEMARFSGQKVRPKIVPMSHYWSYTGTAGMFMPLLGEANVNTDMRPDEILSAAMHEIAHAKGIAREDEANFMAFYTGIRHQKADYRYAAWFSAMIHASNQLYRTDIDLWGKFWDGMDEGIKRDIAARNEYWDAFEGPAKDKAGQVNNSFLVANGEDDGIRSYGRMVDLVLAYYEHEVINANRLTP